MNLDPEQVGRMTPWQFMACLEGHGKANGWKPSGASGAMSLDRLKELGIEGA